MGICFSYMFCRERKEHLVTCSAANTLESCREVERLPDSHLRDMKIILTNAYMYEESMGHALFCAQAYMYEESMRHALFCARAISDLHATQKWQLKNRGR